MRGREETGRCPVPVPVRDRRRAGGWGEEEGEFQFQFQIDFGAGRGEGRTVFRNNTVIHGGYKEGESHKKNSWNMVVPFGDNVETLLKKKGKHLGAMEA